MSARAMTRIDLNVLVSFSRNVVLRGLSFSIDVVPKPRMLSVRAVYVLAAPSLLNSRILRRLDGKWLFHAAAEDRIAVLVLFDKEVLS